MRPAPAFAVLLFSLFTVQSASAAVIGVRGGNPGSEPATDGTAYELSPCVIDGSNYFCAEYVNLEEYEISFLDLAWWNPQGDPILATPENFQVALPESDFPLIRYFVIENDPYLVRLCSEGESACDGLIITSVIPPSEDPNFPDSDSFFRVFSSDPGWVSIQGVNGEANLNAAPRGQQIPVPEPATLLLMGLGVAAVAGRRLCNRRN